MIDPKFFSGLTAQKTHFGSRPKSFSTACWDFITLHAYKYIHISYTPKANRNEFKQMEVTVNRFWNILIIFYIYFNSDSTILLIVQSIWSFLKWSKGNLFFPRSIIYNISQNIYILINSLK